MTMQRHDGFTDETVKRVLQRAIELDTIAGSRVSEAELRTIAQEVGVSTTSLEAALRELEVPAPAEAVTRTAPPRSWRSRLFPLLGGVVAGGAYMFLLQTQYSQGFWQQSHSMAFFIRLAALSGGAMIALASATAAWRARGRSQFEFHTGNTLVWLGAMTGLWLADPVTTFSDVALRVGTVLLIQGWVVSTLIGVIVGALQYRARPRAPIVAPPAGGDGPGLSSTPKPSRWRALTDRIAAWLHIPRVATSAR